MDISSSLPSSKRKKTNPLLETEQGLHGNTQQQQQQQQQQLANKNVDDSGLNITVASNYFVSIHQKMTLQCVNSYQD